MTPLRPASRSLRIAGWVGVAFWTLSITALSSMSSKQLSALAPIIFWDKAEHFIAFAFGAVILALALRWSTRWPPARIALVVISAISAFGALDEIHQLFTPGRSGGDVFDWSADTLGAAAGAWAILLSYVRSARSSLLAPAGDRGT